MYCSDAFNVRWDH